jgi:hypothetical protein
MFTLQDVETLQVKINLPESVMRSLRPNPDAVTTREEATGIPAYATFEGKPDCPFPLTLREVSTRADSRTQTFEVTFNMPAPTEFIVLPGMTATVTIDFASRQPHAARGTGGCNDHSRPDPTVERRVFRQHVDHDHGRTRLRDGVDADRGADAVRHPVPHQGQRLIKPAAPRSKSGADTRIGSAPVAAENQPWRASSFSLFMPSLPITFAAGQKPVNELCSKFAPTKTVSQMNPGWTFHQSNNDKSTMKPAKAETPRSIDILTSSVAAEFVETRRA